MQQYQPWHADDADIDALLDDMERDASTAREVELEVSELRRRLIEQDKTIADLTKRQQQPHGNPEARPQQAPRIDPAVSAWVAANPWFTTDDELHCAAIALESAMMRSAPNAADRLEKVKASLMKTFPHKFLNQARLAPPTVSRPGPQSAGRPKPKTVTTLADLDDDAKTALAAFKKVDPKFTDETYIKIYKTRQ